MDEFWQTIVTSTVIATFISGIITIVISRLQYKDTLKLNQYNKRRDLSIEVFKNLQNSLVQIKNSKGLSHSKNVDDDISSAFIASFVNSKETMEATKDILYQISYLLSRDKVEYLKTRYSEIEKQYIILLASAYHAEGVPISKIAVDVVSSDELFGQMKQYIDDMQKFSDELREEIIDILRQLCGTL